MYLYLGHIGLFSKINCLKNVMILTYYDEIVCIPLQAIVYIYLLFYYCTIVYRLYLLLFGDCCFPRDHDHGIYCKVHRHGFGSIFRIAKYRPEHSFASRSQYSCGSIQIVHPAGQRFFERWRH